LPAVTLTPSDGSEKLINAPPNLGLKIILAVKFQAFVISGGSNRWNLVAMLSLLVVRHDNLFD